MFGLVRPTRGLTGVQPSSMQRWDPWSDMERMRREMDDLVTRAFGFTPVQQLISGQGSTGLPPVELYETEDRFLLCAHLPGMAREDINLELQANRVALWGERRAQMPAEDAKTHLNTAAYGAFRFEYELPVEIQSDNAKATYRDGILEVALPKAESARPKSLKVAIEG